MEMEGQSLSVTGEIGPRLLKHLRFGWTGSRTSRLNFVECITVTILTMLRLDAVGGGFCIRDSTVNGSNVYSTVISDCRYDSPKWEE